MNNIERGWNEVVSRWPKSKIFKPLRDHYGMFGLNVLVDGQLGVFSVKVSSKEPREISNRGTFLSCHAAICDHHVPVFILHKHILWRINPQRITSAYAFRNWLHGALMLNFYTVDVGANAIGSTIQDGEVCAHCGRMGATAMVDGVCVNCKEGLP